MWFFEVDPEFREDCLLTLPDYQSRNLILASSLSLMDNDTMRNKLGSNM